MSVNVVSSRHQGPNRRLGYLRSHFSPRASAQEMTSKNIPCLTRLQGCMATPVVRYNNDCPLRLKCKNVFSEHTIIKTLARRHLEILNMASTGSGGSDCLTRNIQPTEGAGGRTLPIMSQRLSAEVGGNQAVSAVLTLPTIST